MPHPFRTENSLHGLLTAAIVAAGVLSAGCGDRWKPGDPPHSGQFALECQHATASCNSCHPADAPISQLDDDCISCHEQDRPASHDPQTTATCDECHMGSLWREGEPRSTCDWSGGSPHPAGFSDPAAHGLEAKLQGPVEGDCRDCHGETLEGGTTPDGGNARGCDDCHASNEHAEWRTDCTFCHGGVDNNTGAPPRDIDNATGPSEVSFRAHSAHVDDDGDYRALPCLECHGLDYAAGLDPEHWFDATPAAAEISFSRGIAPATTRDGNGACGNNYCHGRGQRDDGASAENSGPMDCESCHRTEAGWDTMSGLHAAHLSSDEGGPIVCNDCHAPVITRDGDIDSPGRHVNGARDIAFYEPTIDTNNNGGTCTGSCHGVDHQTYGWGHVPDYERPDLHGRDSNQQSSDCGSCHGRDWTGGVAQGCDECHADEGHPDWRTDCTFCHGGTLDGSGAPPQDIDDTETETDLSFGAHPEHTGAGTTSIGHPDYTCVECHAVVYDDALAPGHALDTTARRAEVDLSAGWSYEGGYDPVTSTCSNMYCHGNGQTPSGVITDSDTVLDCDSCHATTSDWESMSGTHASHLGVADIHCDDCHAPVVNAAGDVVMPDLHVNRDVDLDLAATGWNVATTTCTTTCHGQVHDDWGWSGPHPEGFDAPEQHGQEALNRLQDCTACHGANLDGGSAQGCDDCHTTNGHADWRSDCVYCHGGAGGDTEGVPPEDIDNNTSEASISFMAHPEHVSATIASDMNCRTCHNGSQNYSDAPSDPGHWLTSDSTPRVAEVSFFGLASGTNYASHNCSNNYCHGNGQQNGARADSNSALDCDGCHSYATDRADMSGTHALHLAVTGPAVTCADCHSGVVNATGTVTARAKHVDGNIDVDNNATVGWNAAAATCTNSCHNHTHTNMSWNGGHPPGYDDPLVHGQDALFVFSDCATSGCHGTDLRGGNSGQGCDSCHSANWRRDCAFCHGTTASGGMPPQDLDNTTNEASITFMAHPEHGDNNIHPRYGCEECHGTASANYTDALTDNNHWFDSTPGLAEVTFSGLATGGTYTRSTSTCGNNYCHGTGVTNGTEVDSNNGLGCADCHDSPPNTGRHRRNDHNDYPCSDCHERTTNGSTTIDEANLHVDGNVDVDMDSSRHSVTWNGTRCSGNCHENHSNESW